MKTFVIIVAGGKGARMGTTLPKQLLTLNNLPILMHTIELFHSHPSVTEEPVVVLPADQISNWRQLIKQYNFSVPHELAEGGASRFQSVRNGLKKIPQGAIVGIHDGVRPLVSSDVIEKTYRLARQHDAVIPVIKPAETLRKINKEGSDSTTMDRDKFVLVQTPQVFKSDLIKEAYQAKPDKRFTDDATVVEQAGYQIYLTDGNKENIKITTPFDLLLAETLMKEQ